MDGRMLSVFACLCVCFFTEAASIRRTLPEILPSNSGDVIMKEDAEEMFYNVNLEKYDDLGISCREPSAPENGVIRGSGRVHHVGSVVYVQCMEGFWLKGAQVMDCVPGEDDESAVWEPVGGRECVEGHPEFAEENDSSSSEEESLELPESQPALPERETSQFSSDFHTILLGRPEMPSYLNRVDRPWAKKFHNFLKPSKDGLTISDEERTAKENSAVFEQLSTAPAYCVLPPDQGPCKASFQRFYFDMHTAECVSFVFGGCYGNKNNFESMDDCNTSCLTSA